MDNLIERYGYANSAAFINTPDIPHNGYNGSVTLTSSVPRSPSDLETILAEFDKVGERLAAALRQIEASADRLLGPAQEREGSAPPSSTPEGGSRLEALRLRLAKLDRQTERACGIANRLGPAI